MLVENRTNNWQLSELFILVDLLGFFFLELVDVLVHVWDVTFQDTRVKRLASSLQGAELAEAAKKKVPKAQMSHKTRLFAKTCGV